VILTNNHGRPWQANAFRKAWGGASRKAGIVDLTFHDLRGTAVTRLSEAECTPQEIATITGHSLRDVGAIIDRYSARTDKLAIAAIAKLERGRQ
jgi:integrase